MHNARNRALWGTWRTDDWNPCSSRRCSPALEYGAVCDVRRRHLAGAARLAVSASWRRALLTLGLPALGGPRAGLVRRRPARHELRLRDVESRGAHGIDDDRVHRRVRWARTPAAQDRPPWGLAAGVAAVLAFFTKAAAAFFVAALGLDVAARARSGAVPTSRLRTHGVARSRHGRPGTLAGLAGRRIAALVVFVRRTGRSTSSTTGR